MARSSEKARNQLRGAFSSGIGRACALVSELRTELHPGRYRELVSWIGALPPPKGRPLLAGTVWNSRLLFSRPEFSKVPYEAELSWAKSQLARSRSQIDTYRALSERLYDAILAGDRATAFGSLDSIQKALGVSVWLMDARLAVSQLFDGLEAQKAYALQVSKAAASLPFTVAHFASQRNEELVSSRGFIARTREVLERWALPATWDLYLRYILLREIPKTEDQCSDLLRAASASSVIDLYEAVLITESACAQFRGSRSPKAVLTSLGAVAVDDRRQDVSQSRGTDAESSSTRPDRKRVEDVIAAARLGAQKQLRLPDTNIEQSLSFLLATLLQRSRSAESSEEAIEKLGLNLGFIPLVRSVVAATRYLRAPNPVPFEQSVRAIIALDRVMPDLPPDVAPFDVVSRSRNSSISFSEIERQLGDAAVVHPMLDELLVYGDVHDHLQAAKYRVLVHAQNGEWWDAVRISVSCVLRYPGCEPELDLASVLRGLTWLEFKAHVRNFELSIGLLLVERASARRQSQSDGGYLLQQAALHLLKARGVKLYSDLVKVVPEEEQSLLIFFLANVCTSQTMEVNTAIMSSRGLSEERMRICQILAQIDPDQAGQYVEEIKQLTYELELEQGVQAFDRSRIYVNVDSLQRWALKNIADDFARYKSLVTHGLSDLVELQQALTSLQGKPPGSVQGAAIPKPLLEGPRTEADKLLFDIVKRLATEFQENPIDGFDSYLSLRVRHGSFSGHLRGPLEELHLVTVMEEATGRYRENEYWLNRLPIQDVDMASGISAAFERFSAAVDTELTTMAREYIQIRKESKPKGVFEVPISAVLLNLIKVDVSPETPIETFLDRCFSHFLLQMENGLRAMQELLDTSLRSRIKEELNKLRADLQSLLVPAAFVELGDAITRASTNCNNAIDRVRDWFTAASIREMSVPYTLRQVIDIGVAVTRNAHPGFDPVISVEVDSKLPPVTAASGALILADVMFIALDNVYSHSGVPRNPSVTVSVARRTSALLEIRVVSEVAPGVRSEAALAKLEKIRSLIESDEYRSRVTAEGGTGFLKLRKIGAGSASLKGVHNVNFGFVDDDEFFLEILVPIFEGSSNE